MDVHQAISRRVPVALSLSLDPIGLRRRVLTFGELFTEGSAATGRSESGMIRDSHSACDRARVTCFLRILLNTFS